jgi:hypothetical protein
MTYSKHYAHSENLAVDSYSTLQEADYFQTVHTQETHSGIKIYEQCDMSGYTYNTGTYSGEDMTCVTTNMTAIHTVVKELIKC